MMPPQSAVSTAQTCHESSYVVAVIEGRGISREVGIAAMDRDTGKTVLIQVADCQTYVKTMHHIQLHPPKTILVPDTFLSPNVLNGQSIIVLIDLLQEEFPSALIEPVARKYWCESVGLEFLHQLCIADEDRTALLVSISHKYYALSAIAALFKYFEIKKIVFAMQSLRITYRTVEGTMMIDTDTMKQLELFENVFRKHSKYSLCQILNFTYTPMGSRLLRVNLLSPVAVLSSIDARLDVVEELVRNEDTYTAIKSGLRTLSKIDLDKILVDLVSLTSGELSTRSNKPAMLRIKQLLYVRDVVQLLPSLQSSLQGGRCQLFQAISKILSDERIGKIEKLIAESINDDNTIAKRTGLTAVNIRVYAIKASINRLLDVARETYRENLGDIYSLCRELTEEHSIPLQLKFSESTGYSFTLKQTEHEGNLPSGFVNITARGDHWHFSHIDLKKKNARLRDSLDEVLILSDRIIQELVDNVIQQIGALYKASEAIALIDMLWSFAHVAIIRPEFTGTLAIKGGRHPIIDSFVSSNVTPNDVYSCDSSFFQIIQGPNMSGKSTYLRQIGLLNVMAMCGSFVPAEYASFRILDALLTRLSNDDDMLRNLSTFANEMVLSTMILSLASPNSLILIDELGRGTSSCDGIGLCHAIAEDLIRKKSFVFFATHFRELSLTLSRHPSVVNLHFSIENRPGPISAAGIVFKHRIMNGVAEEEDQHYGILLAKLADYPPALLKSVEILAKKLSMLQENKREMSYSEKMSIRRKSLFKLHDQLFQALLHSTFSQDKLLLYLRKLQCNITQALDESYDKNRC